MHQHAKLPCASPDTILVEPSSAVYYIFTHRDATTAKRITLTTSEDKESFVSFALERMLQPLLRKNIELSSSTVAVVKRPLARKTVANTTETISPLDLLAMLLDIADSNTGPLVLQQYIYPRGKNPTFCRIHWKNSTTSASGSSTAYLLTPTAPAKLGIVEEVEGEADGEVKSAHDMMSAFGKRYFLSATELQCDIILGEHQYPTVTPSTMTTYQFFQRVSLLLRQVLVAATQSI